MTKPEQKQAESIRDISGAPRYVFNETRRQKVLERLREGQHLAQIESITGIRREDINYTADHNTRFRDQISSAMNEWRWKMDRAAQGRLNGLI